MLATISKDGDITNVKLISGDALLADAAIDAVKQWKYKPYYLNSEPMEIQTQITVNFTPAVNRNSSSFTSGARFSRVSAPVLFSAIKFPAVFLREL